MTGPRSAEEIAEVAAARGKVLGLSEREISIQVTSKPDLLRDMRRGRMPAADRIAMLAAVLKVSMDDLLGPEVGFLTHLEVLPPSTDLPADVPVLGTALGADLQIDNETKQATHIEQTIIEEANVVAFMRRPPSLARSRDIYALYIVGSSMSPRYEPGEAVYVNPRRPPSVGDDVVIQIGAPDGAGGQQVISALIKRLVRRTSAYIELEQFTPPERFRLGTEQIAAIHRVMPWSEVLAL